MTASNDDKRLLFNGCQCGKCGCIFGEEDHPDLPKDLLRSTDKLRSKVHSLIDEHNLIQENPGINAKQEMLYKEAMRKYAFYLCGHCKDPYFGGTIECADEISSQSSSNPETRLCPACAPQSQTICQNPSEHGRYLVWKCRYCCRPSSHVCYGNVHFCNDCHDKHSSGAKLEMISCYGDACPYPKQGDSKKHSNGSSPDCEQVYSCVLCDSIGNSRTSDPLAIEAGSRNFLKNPSGQEGLNHWRRFQGQIPWIVELHDNQEIPSLLQTPVLGSDDRLPIATNFVSTFRTCAMAQTVDLRNVLRLGSNSVPRNVRLEASARYTGRTDCPSVFELRAVLHEKPVKANGNSTRPQIIPPQRKRSGTLEAPPGVYWERASLEFELDTTGNVWKRPMVTVAVLGKDQRFWQGNFGSKVADITLRVVGSTAEEMESLVKPLGEETSAGQNNNSSSNNSNVRGEETSTQRNNNNNDDDENKDENNSDERGEEHTNEQKNDGKILHPCWGKCWELLWLLLRCLVLLGIIWLGPHVILGVLFDSDNLL